MGLNGLESLYGLDMRRSEEMTAKDIMETDLKVVPCQTTVSETACAGRTSRRVMNTGTISYFRHHFLCYCRGQILTS